MYVTLACFDLTTWSLVCITYIIHIITWAARPSYRTLHNHVTTSTSNGFYQQMAQKLFRSMIKSGEITFRRQQSAGVQDEEGGSDKRGVDKKTDIPLSISPSSSGSSSQQDRETEHQGSGLSQGFCNSSFGSKVLVVSCDSIIRSQDNALTPAVSSPTPVISSGSCVAGEGNSSDNRTNSYNVSMMYSSGANSPVTVVNTPKDIHRKSHIAVNCGGKEFKPNKNDTDIDETKSISIDYEMLGGVRSTSSRQDPTTHAATKGGLEIPSEQGGRESDAATALDVPVTPDGHAQTVTKVVKSHLKIFDQLFAQLQFKHQ